MRLLSMTAGVLAIAAGTACGQDGFVGYGVGVAGADGVLIGQLTRTVVPVSTSAPFTPVTIPVDNLVPPTGGFIVVHVYDTDPTGQNGGALDSIAMLTVSRSNSAQVRLVVADRSFSDLAAAFNFPSFLRPAGLRDIGGVTFASAGSPASNGTDVSVNIIGDVTGDVTSGRVTRVRAARNTDGSGFGGAILGDIVATGFDSDENVLAIRHVQADWSIDGDIIALGNQATPESFISTDRGTWASVDKVWVGPSDQAPGIAGNILCEYGGIEEIYCTGPIGTADDFRSQIRAGMYLNYLAVRSSEFAPAAAAGLAPIYADVAIATLGYCEAPSYTPAEFIETAGDFVGTIHAKRLTPKDCLYKPGNLICRKGILIGGNFIGDIVIDDSVIDADIIARSFRADSELGFGGTVTIGRVLAGALVAVGTGDPEDGDDGTIQSVDIGNGPQASACIASAGLAGPGAPLPAPFEGEQRVRWYTSDPSHGGSADCVVRAARRIENLNITLMSHTLPQSGGSTRPRVESPELGTVNIAHMDSGVLWSGKLDTPFSMSDSYAKVDQVAIGCVGPTADLWLTPNLAAGSEIFLDITGTLYGEVHLPSLPSGRTVRIGGAFSDTVAAEQPNALCQGPFGTFIFPYNYPFPANLEQSPRTIWFDVEDNLRPLPPFTPPTGIPVFGRIILQNASSLNGHIIIDASNTTGAHRTDAWLGDVVIGTGTPQDPLDEVIISTNSGRATFPAGSNADAIAPLYTIPSHILAGLTPPARGGAVGLVPFARYEADCNPLNAYGLQLGQADFIFDLPLQDPDHEYPEVAFYGPIAINGDRGVDLLRVDPYDFENTVALGASIWDDEVPANLPRVLRLTPGSLGDIPPGRNRVEPLPTLVCDLGPDYPATIETFGGAPLAPHFDFVLGHECIPVAPAETCLCLHTWCFLADFDFSGSLDGEDVILFFAAWDSSNDLADLNLENGVDGDDVILFFCWWDEGCSF